MQIKKVLLAFILSLSLSNYNPILPCGLKHIIDNFYKTIKKEFRNYREKREENREINKFKKIWEKTNLFGAISIWPSGSEEKAAIHEAGHLVVSKALNCDVLRVTVKGADGLTFYLPKNKETSIYVLLAGFLSEVAIFGKSSDGCYEDIGKVTKRIIELHELNPADIKQIKEVMQNYLDKTEEIILQNLDLIKKFANLIIEQKYDKAAGGKILYKKQIDQVYEKLT